MRLYPKLIGNLVSLNIEVISYLNNAANICMFAAFCLKMTYLVNICSDTGINKVYRSK